MDYRAKIEYLFITLLIRATRRRYGLSEICQLFELPAFGISRSFVTMRGAGFVPECHYGFYSMHKMGKSLMELSDLPHYFEAETFNFKKATQIIFDTSLLKPDLIRKLYPLYSSDCL